MPDELVMTAPAQELVSQGAIMWRLVHARIQPGEEFTDIRIRFVAASPGPITPSVDSPDECYPNTLGKLDFRLRNQPTGAPDDATAEIGLGGVATIDRASLDLAYMAELVALFTGSRLKITPEDGAWSISSDTAFSATEWKPMSLRDASHAVAFAAHFQLSLAETGDCLIDQIIAAQGQQSPEALTLRASIKETAAYWMLDQFAQGTAADQTRLRHTVLGLLAREDTIPPTAADALKIDYLANLNNKFGGDVLTRDYEQLRLAAEYEKRVIAAKTRLGGLTPAYICENLLSP